MYIPINSDTGLDQVHYTWAGAAVLEALCLVYPTVNFVLADSDCVPTSLFEVAELVNLMTDRTSRAEAMQQHTMASSNQSPPAVLLMTESKAELNAGLIIVTGHAATQERMLTWAQKLQMQACQRPALLILMPCDARARKSRRLAHPADSKSPEEWVTALCDSRASFLATTAVPDDPAEALRGGLILTPIMGCKARTPLDWTHAWAMLGEWAGKIAFPIPEDGKWPRHGHGIYLRPDYIHRTPPFLTWARPIFEQGALSPMSVLPADFPILCLPGDKLFSEQGCGKSILPSPNSACFSWKQSRNRKEAPTVAMARSTPLAVALIGVDQLPPLWTHPTGSDFVRGSKLVAKPHVAEQRKLTQTQVLLLQSLWTPVEFPHHSNNHTPWPQTCQATYVLCGQQASLQLPTNQIRPLLEALQKRLQIDSSNPELAINEILASHAAQNIKIGKKSLGKTPVGNSIPLTQGTWMLSAPDWVEESWTTTGKSSWHAEKKPTYMVLL